MAADPYTATFTDFTTAAAQMAALLAQAQIDRGESLVPTFTTIALGPDGLTWTLTAMFAPTPTERT